MPTDHGFPDTLLEVHALAGDLLPAVVLSATFPVVPVASLTLAAFPTTAYVRAGAQLVYVQQPAISLTLAGGNGTYWVAIGADVHTALAGWTRRPGSHYVWQGPAGTQPAHPDGALVFLQVTVAGSVITAVIPIANSKAPILAQQNANAVAITDGRISLGGHAPTGVFDVQGSVVASDAANQYYGVRVWPVAPTSATIVQGLRIEAPTGTATGTAQFNGIAVNNPPVSTANVLGYVSNITAGSGRYNFYALGTAPNYLAGGLGIGQVPYGNAQLTLKVVRASTYGLTIQPDADTGAAQPVSFINAAGTAIGSISTTATATAYNTSSDHRLKRNISTLTNTIASLKAVRPVSYLWNVDDAPGEGFLAHELMVPFPLAVSGLPDEVHPDGSIKPQQVDHSKLVPRMVAWMQEMLQRLEAIESALGL